MIVNFVREFYAKWWFILRYVRGYAMRADERDFVSVFLCISAKML